MKRVTQHPILDIPPAEEFTITVDGREVTAREGETVAAVLLANGIRTFRHTAKRGEPRGIFCGIGQCNDCVVVVNGRPNVRSCVTPLEEGMAVETQKGLGKAGVL
jgi:predicted molibdopterin-dependent oxidoreductase YjgC